jgi:hypothetical protein
MKQREFLIEAAGFFLCLENGGLSIEEQLKLLEKVCEKGEQIHPPDEVIVWEPFEYWMADRILEEIYNLSGLLENIYQKGYNDRKTI